MRQEFTGSGADATLQESTYFMHDLATSNGLSYYHYASSNLIIDYILYYCALQ